MIQGKLDVRALRTITGQIQAKLAIFVEDDFAELMVTTALRSHGSIELDEVKVHAMGGHGAAIKVNSHHNLDPTATYPSICVLDGDQAEQANPDKGIFTLPGASLPEAHVLERVLDCLDEEAGRLAFALHLDLHDQERVKKVVKERALTNWDRHMIWEQIGGDLDFASGHIVKSAFLATWARKFPEEVKALVEAIGDKLPRRDSTQP